MTFFQSLIDNVCELTPSSGWLAGGLPLIAPPALQHLPAETAGQELANSLPERLKFLTEMTIAGNELWRVVALFLSLFVGLLVGRLLRFILNQSAARFVKYGRRLAAVSLLAIARAIVFVSVVLGLQAGLQFLVLHPVVDSISVTVVRVLMTTAIGYTAFCLIIVVDEWLRSISEKTTSKLDDMLVPLVRRSLQGTIVVLVLVQIATILSEKPVTSIIAGLGVGGLAVGLAAQDTIKNFFGSLMIFGDRPFELGDEIIVDNITGSVESVGFRSTRYRTGDGHLVTTPNGELANKTIVNVSKRLRLARRFNLTLSAALPPKKAERAVAIVREILESHEGQDERFPPRVFLSEMGPAGLTLSINYWYQPPDWWKFVAFNERVNLDILRRFEAEEISLVATPPPPAAPVKPAS